MALCRVIPAGAVHSEIHCAWLNYASAWSFGGEA